MSDKVKNIVDEFDKKFELKVSKLVTKEMLEEMLDEVKALVGLSDVNREKLKKRIDLGVENGLEFSDVALEQIQKFLSYKKLDTNIWYSSSYMSAWREEVKRKLLTFS